jgi:hypothetical protein
VVPSEVIPDVVILELLYRFASARGLGDLTLGEDLRAKKGNTHRRLEVRQISMQVRRASTTFLCSSSKNVACPRRSGPQLSSCLVSAAELSFFCLGRHYTSNFGTWGKAVPNSVNILTSAMCSVTPSPSARAIRKSSMNAVISPALLGKKKIH